MFALLRSAFNYGAGLFLKTGIVKWGVMFAAFYLISDLLVILLELALPAGGIQALNSAFSGIPSEMWFFMNLFQISYGIPLIISAFITRFIIRRLPIIG
jgi:Protein of unknown function (DUF2523)